jgi:hypothetical protein
MAEAKGHRPRHFPDDDRLVGCANACRRCDRRSPGKPHSLAQAMPSRLCGCPAEWSGARASGKSQERRLLHDHRAQFRWKLLPANRSLSHANRVSGPPSPRSGKRFSDARDRRPQTASEGSFFLTETGSRPMRPRKIAGIWRTTGNLVWRRTAWWDREDSNRQPDGYQPRPAKFRIRSARTRHGRWSQKGLAFCCEPSGSVVVLG